MSREHCLQLAEAAILGMVEQLGEVVAKRLLKAVAHPDLAKVPTDCLQALRIEKARYRLDSGLSFIFVVPET